MRVAHPLEDRLSQLLARKPSHLEGPDAQHWQIALQAVEDRDLPEGALVFAENGAGDYLFLQPDRQEVMVFWHEGPEIEVYCPTVEELLPGHRRPPSAHPPVFYFNSEELVLLGDRVRIRYWLFFKGVGTITYVPGVSRKKPNMERDGLAWVRVKLDDKTGAIDTIVTESACLQKSVKLLARSSS